MFLIDAGTSQRVQVGLSHFLLDSVMTDEYMAACDPLFDVEDFVLESAPLVGRTPEDY
jgi:hypothetical protein